MTMLSDIRKALVSVRQTDRQFTAELNFPADLEVFAGHFPQQPLVPGIFEIEATVQLLNQLTGQRWQINNIGRSKFTTPLKPDQPVVIDAAWQPVSDSQDIKLKATITCADQPAAKLTLTLAPDPIEDTTSQAHTNP